MTDFTPVTERYIASWNETDPTARRESVTATFAADATYVDPLMAGEGHDGIDAMIGAAQGQFPGFAFRLIAGPDGFGDHVRFSWALGPVGTDQTVIAGTDFCGVAPDGRLHRVTGFIDQMPAAGEGA